MKKLLVVGGLLAVSACTSTPKTDFVSQINQEFNKAPSAAGIGTEWAKGYILVQPRAGLSDEEFDRVLRGNNGRKKERLANLPIHKIEVPEHAEDAVVRALSKNPSIKFAEKDMLVDTSELIPDDPRYADQYHLKIIQASTAWSLSQGDGVVVAVLDSGVYGAHPDLSSKVVDGWNVVSNNADTSDIQGHGTAVAGFVGAATNNLTGIASSGFNAKIMPVRVTNRTDGAAYFSDIAKGINWAANNGAKVANVSFGVVNSSSVRTAAQDMRNKGGVVVSSAGNSNTDLGYSDNPYLITVAATTSSDTKASFSNYGDYVDLAAPGAGVLTTNRSGGYSSWNGTSFSSPITAGVAALVMSANPNLTPDQVETVLENSADDLVAGVDWHMYYGHGRVNAEKAVQLALDTSAQDTEAPQVAIFSPLAGGVVKGSVLVEVSATDNTGVNEVSLYVNGMLLASDITTPYQFSWDSTQEADGFVTLTATASDAVLNEGTSAEVNIEVKNALVVEDYTAPEIMINNPVEGSTLVRTVNISVTAVDNIEVAETQLFINDALVNTIVGGDLSYSWNTRKIADGDYLIRATATDTSGNVVDSSVITVTKGAADTTDTTTAPVRGKKK